MWHDGYVAAQQEALAEARRQICARDTRAHLVGIGGVGMAGVALHLHARGLLVSGCDASASSITEWLEARGIPVRRGHDPSHVGDDLAWLVCTAAVDATHPEVAEARRRGIPVTARGLVLAALVEHHASIAVSGTHGKTTTTAMIAQMLRACGRDASFAVGAEVEALGGVAGVGKDASLVVEADESDGTVSLYAPDIAVITHADLDHVDFFRSPDQLQACLRLFGSNARKIAVVSWDDPGARALADQLPRVVTYGVSREAAVSPHVVGTLDLPVAGEHNLQNALAACAVGLELGLPLDAIKRALRAFRPARRRFETIGEAGGIRIVSDYAHHPTEIAALLGQARAVHPGRIVAVFQPHRYTRTAAMGAAFGKAFRGVDALMLAPVYAASEKPVPGGTSRDIVRHFSGNTALAGSLAEAWAGIRTALRPGDLFLVVGAGDVEKIAFWARDALQEKAV